jgi:hypothetical protein
MTELIKDMNSIKENLSKVTIDYINKDTQYQLEKIKVIDPDIRDSVEKQMIRAFKEDPSLMKLHLEVEELRRKRDYFIKQFDILKTVSILTKEI